MKTICFSKVLQMACSGDPDALIALIAEYQPIIHHHSVVDGRFNEDCFQYILLRLLSKIKKFRI
ncbi:MAG: helix-turn-helix domain-containing protein [Christensenellales bacterium]